MTVPTPINSQAAVTKAGPTDICPCPACRKPMAQQRFKRQQYGEIELDLCFSCQGIWFDESESTQLAPEGVVKLFQVLHEHNKDLRQPWRDTLQCPRCNNRMLNGMDRTVSGHFSYHRCPEQHGRFNSFGAFLTEKGFVRQLNNQEIADLAKRIRTILCTGCGAPVDIRRENVCGHCRSPIVILDPEAVEKALANYAQKTSKQHSFDPTAMADLIISNEKYRSEAQRAKDKKNATLNVVDIVLYGIDIVYRIMR